MRRVSKDYNNPPAELIKCTEINEKELLEYKKVNGNCYKKAGKYLEELYLKKCAYCEQKYLANSDTWIEHYRPKSKENYYWLAYEWSNLIPTCTKCNRKKKANFPLINEPKRVKNPPLKNGKLNLKNCSADFADLINEQPFVLHPEIDEPEDCFDFQIDESKKGVKIVGKDILGRGNETAKLCDLNREDLKLDRQEKVIDKILEIIDFLFHCDLNGDMSNDDFVPLFSFIYQKLESDSENMALEHTLFRKSILPLSKFEEIVCPYIKNNKQREIIIKTYKKVCKN
ncbi:MAG: HNH endonuclease [Bacteroidales bacterium]|nr:HNH endonuclease [Bacteroidales bacterium]